MPSSVEWIQSHTQFPKQISMVYNVSFIGNFNVLISIAGLAHSPLLYTKVAFNLPNILNDILWFIVWIILQKAKPIQLFSCSFCWYCQPFLTHKACAVLVWRRRPFSFYYYYAWAKEKGLVKLTYTTCATAHADIAACQSDCLK